MENKTKRYLLYVSRTFVIWVGQALGLLLLIHFVPGLSVNSFAAAFALVVLLGIVNAILWPILTRSTLRFLTYTFGIGALLLNALLVWLASLLVPGASVEGLAALILTPIGLAAINVVLASLLTNNDGAWYYRNILSREVKKAGGFRRNGSVQYFWRSTALPNRCSARQSARDICRGVVTAYVLKRAPDIELPPNEGPLIPAG